MAHLGYSGRREQRTEVGETAERRAFVGTEQADMLC